MNRLLAVIIVLLVLGIGVSRANDILVALSPYEAAKAAPVPAPPPIDATDLVAQAPE
jgi:hypothetical protein